MFVVQRCRENNWSKIAFIGTTKHAGKTTALNAFIDESTRLGLTLGICSIGLDGERLDTIMGVEKPSIVAPTGTLVVSAERALAGSDAQLEWLEALPIESPLGTVMVARVLSPGRVLLAGVRTRAHVKEVLRHLTPDLVDISLVDGAFDRVAAASPGLVDAAILAVGAVAGKTVADVVTHAYPNISRFQLERVDETVRRLLEPAYKQDEIGILADGELQTIPKHQSVFGVTAHAAFNSNTHTVFIPGAITNSLLESLMLHARTLELVASHPAQILASGESLRRFWRKGHRLCVYHELPLAAIAVNPRSILGYELPKADLMAEIRALAPDVPVYDALQGGEL